MKKNIILASLIFISVLSSCKKDKAIKEEEEVASATITINEPISNSNILFNEEVHFEGVVSGTGKMHGYTIEFTNLKTNTSLYKVIYDVHADFYNFHEHWTNNLTDTTEVELKIDVTKDHHGNHEIKKINVICLP